VGDVERGLVLADHGDLDGGDAGGDLVAPLVHAHVAPAEVRADALRMRAQDAPECVAEAVALAEVAVVGEGRLLRALEARERVEPLVGDHRVDDRAGRLDVVRAHGGAGLVVVRGPVVDAGEDLLYGGDDRRRPPRANPGCVCRPGPSGAQAAAGASSGIASSRPTICPAKRV
jgi:hypothetical protein